MATEQTHGHIRGENRPDLDVFLNGERMDKRDGFDEGVALEHRGEDRAVKVVVAYTDGLTVGASVWDDPDEAFSVKPEYIDLDRVGDAGDVFARFEARERDLTVELREVS
jgi:hypothetical protein